MTGLRISSALTLPPDTVTSTLVVYGGKGMGKTNLLTVVLEEMSKARLRWCALDPVGVLWGLRHAADGHGAGVECLILGGVHGDIAIYPDSGEIVADLVADNDVSVIVDCSRNAQGQMWSVGERTRFLTAFARRIFQRQGSLIDGRRREPLFIALDEAARYIPEQIPAGNPDLSKSVGAWEQLVEEGRNVGIGVGLFTQRSARLKKSVAELADAMLAFRTVGPRSIDAVMDWLGEHVAKAHVRELVEQLRQIAVGTALVVSPGWLRFEGVVAIRARETFDSSETPKPGQRARRVQGRGAVVDLETYKQRMAETVERAKADDPKELHKQIAQLERDLVAERAKPQPEPVEIRVEVPVLMPEIVEQIEAALAPAAALLGEAQETLAKHRMWAEQQLEVPRGRQDLPRTREAGRRPDPVATSRTQERPDPTPRRDTGRPAVQGSAASADLGKGERVILTAVAQYNAGVTREQLTVLTGYKRSSRDTYLQRLRSAGLVHLDGIRLVATADGYDALGTDFERLPTGAALRDHWLERLGGGEQAILASLIHAYPDAVDREELSLQTGYKRSSRDTYLQRLRARQLITTDGHPRAADTLFDGAGRG